MEYQMFLEGLKKILEKRLDRGIQIRINTVKKYNNVVKDSLSIFKEGENISPAIYLDDYFRRYEKGDTLEKIAFQILSVYSKRIIKDKLDMTDFMNWNTASKNIIPRLVNTEKNEKLLETIPGRAFLNLSVIYVYRLENFTEGNASITINNQHMKMWNVSIGELDKAAFTNIDQRTPFKFTSMQEMLKDMMGTGGFETPDMDGEMYVLTNDQSEYGAVWICREDKLKLIRETLGREYLVLPSSVHECIIIPAEIGISRQEIASFVKEINQTQVAPEEVLADCIYMYAEEDGKLHMC